MEAYEKCPYCNRPKVFYRRWLKNYFCGWCKRFFVFETCEPKYLGRRIRRLGKWHDIVEDPESLTPGKLKGLLIIVHIFILSSIFLA